MHRFLLPLALALVPVLAGCPVRPDFGPYGRLEDPAFVLRSVRHRYGLVEALRGEGRMSVSSPDGSGSLRFAAEVAEPGRVYLETADFLGTPRGTFATDGDRFAFHLPAENRFFAGPATAETIGRFLPVALGPEELAAVLLAEPPLLEGELSMEVDPDASVYVIRVVAPDGAQRITVGTRDLRLLSVETRGPRAWDVFLEAFDEKLLPGQAFPKGIRLMLPGRDTEVRLRYGDLALGVEPDPTAFELAPPSGVPIEPVE